MSSFNFITIRLGKDSIPDIKKICSSGSGILSNVFSINVRCTQIPDNYGVGDYAFLWLGSDNNKGMPTQWKQGFKAVGCVKGVNRGKNYNDTSETIVEIVYIFNEAVNRMDILRCAPVAYYWCSSLPLIGLDDHANQTIRSMSGNVFVDLKAFFTAIDAVTNHFKVDIIRIEPKFKQFFDIILPNPRKYPLAKNLKDITIELHNPEDKQKPLQQIFYGAPGTGKSNIIKKIVDEQKKRCHRTTFHPDSDYSTFVGAYKPSMSKEIEKSAQPILDYDSLVDKFKEYLTVPNANITKVCTLFGYDYHDSIIRIQEHGHKILDLVNDAYKSNTSYDSVVRGGMACFEHNPIKKSDSKITYKFVPQAFTNAYVEAWNTEEEVYLIIEEINRGNCAQIFGDLFQLLDRKNGISEYPVEADADLQSYLNKALSGTTRTDIPEDVKSGEKLMLPSNLYIWATMNTSDQSLFPIDSAFKRRWEWKYIKIKEGKDENGNKLDWKVAVKIDDTGEVLSWWAFIQKINEIIASITSSADKQLGYFFCCAKDGVIDEEMFVSKVIFYLWNDVFKDYGFEDTSLFRYITKDKEGKEMERDLTFPDFYDEDGEKVDAERLTDFVKKVMNWKKTSEENG